MIHFVKESFNLQRYSLRGFSRHTSAFTVRCNVQPVCQEPRATPSPLYCHCHLHTNPKSLRQPSAWSQGLLVELVSNTRDPVGNSEVCVSRANAGGVSCTDELPRSTGAVQPTEHMPNVCKVPYKAPRCALFSQAGGHCMCLHFENEEICNTKRQFAVQCSG